MPNSNRNHLIQFNEDQLQFIRECVFIATQSTPSLNEQLDSWDNPMGAMMLGCIDDTLEIPDDLYDPDQLNGFYI